MITAIVAVCVTLLLLWILSGYLPVRNIAMPEYTVARLLFLFRGSRSAADQCRPLLDRSLANAGA
jgi:hypothetical protein